MTKYIGILFFLLCGSVAIAQMQIETIQLQGRPAAEMIDVIRPMVHQGGSVSGTGYTLIIRSTPDNIEQIKALLADIDKAPEQLIISVAMARDMTTNEQGQSQSVTITGESGQARIGQTTPSQGGGQVRIENDRIKYDARMYERRNRQDSPAIQKVRVTEGLWASIGAGQSIPVRTRQVNPNGTVTETVTHQDVTTGFQVKPRVNNEQVTLSIRPQRQSPASKYGGVYNTTQLETTVTGQLERWIPLGNVINQVNASGHGILSEHNRQGSSSEQLWVKVERAN